MRLGFGNHAPQVITASMLWQVRTGGQGRDRTADLPLFRSKDRCAGPATEVSFAAQGRVLHADGRRCTWMYETRNETARGTAAVSARRHVCRRDLLPDNRPWSASRLTADSE